VVNLLANEDEENKCALSFLDLLKASLRLRPDRIFVSELRGDIAYPYLRASISGHPGSLTTLHAGSVEQAKEQLALMLAESEALSNGSDSRLKSIVNHSVDVIVQMAKEEDGSRIIDDLYYREGEKHGNH
jgi:type IV secretion system protein VirB11